MSHVMCLQLSYPASVSYVEAHVLSNGSLLFCPNIMPGKALPSLHAPAVMTIACLCFSHANHRQPVSYINLAARLSCRDLQMS